jgi:hypothetical protein
LRIDSKLNEGTTICVSLNLPPVEFSRIPTAGPPS